MIGHHARRSGRSAAAGHHPFSLAAYTVIAALLCPGTGAAQVFSIPPRQPPAAAHNPAPQRLSQRLLELLQMAPYYEMFAALTQCSRQAVLASLNAAVDQAGAEDLAPRLCSEPAQRLRALLAREVGVEQAALFYRTFQENVRRSAASAWARKPGPPPIPPQYQVNARRRVGNWSLEPQDGGGCTATYMDPQPLGSTIILHRQGPTVWLRIGSRASPVEPRYPNITLILNVVTPTGVQDVIAPIAVASLSDGTLWYDTPLTDEDLDVLAHARGFRARNDTTSVDRAREGEIFAIDPIAPILDTLKHC